MTESTQADLRELRRKAQELRKGRRIEEALPFYSVIWEQHRGNANEWDGWGFAFCLKHVGHYEQSLAVCHEVEQEWPEFGPIRNVHAWCLYYLYAKKEREEIADNPQEFFGAANEIVRLTEGQWNSRMSPYILTCFKVTNYLGPRATSSAAQQVLEWTGRLDPRELETNASYWTGNDGKQIRTPSDRERYYNASVKALQSLARHEEALCLCDEALTAFPEIHPTFEIWMKYRKGVCLVELGRHDEAIEILRLVLRQKKEWFIRHVLAKAYLGKGDLDSALRCGVEAVAIDNSTDMSKRWEVFLTIAQVLIACNEDDMAKKHAAYAAGERKRMGWGTNTKLDSVCSSLGITDNDIDSFHDLKPELERYWQSVRLNLSPRGTGTVANLLPSGAGFIRDDDGNNYYFNRQAFKGPKHELQPGIRVAYFIEESYDARKRCDSMEALDIQLA